MLSMKPTLPIKMIKKIHKVELNKMKSKMCQKQFTKLNKFLTTVQSNKAKAQTTQQHMYNVNIYCEIMYVWQQTP